MEGGADVEIVDARGRTVREIAGRRDQIDVELLLQDGEQRAWLLRLLLCLLIGVCKKTVEGWRGGR